jgi:hypothetical protein
MGVKRPGREVDHSPSSFAEMKNEWSLFSDLPYAFMVCTHGHNLYLHYDIEDSEN